MVANGICCHADALEHPSWNGTHPRPCVGPNATAMACDLHTHSWLALPEHPTCAGRTTGACSTTSNGGAEALHVLSGIGAAVSQLTLAVPIHLHSHITFTHMQRSANATAWYFFFANANATTKRSSHCVDILH